MTRTYNLQYSEEQGDAPQFDSCHQLINVVHDINSVSSLETRWVEASLALTFVQVDVLTLSEFAYLS